ncbi:hypothetical protein [Bacillus suaedaesalsae]|uniref:Uncharacterized protein n=1 Tax=Bacillus suaedaesalsae TaxID=2810349 RepID=A0ABS2DE25_9BACI|nr:hypothetical protein [Bacillus suaedaesalsae]MBM6616683.1 hypothetical protein [Bacillus suaedaesalsae]
MMRPNTTHTFGVKVRNIIVIFFLVWVVLLSNSPAFATKWVMLEPEEVLERADVVVVGTYDFTSEPQYHNGLFGGYEFDADVLYKGETTKGFIAGVPADDAGWMMEHQEAGGKFLLLLEESKEEDFLVPVAGINGIIDLVNGEASVDPTSRKEFYENYLREQPELPFEAQKLVTKGNWGLIPVVLVLGIVVIVYYIVLKKRS